MLPFPSMFGQNALKIKTRLKNEATALSMAVAFYSSFLSAILRTDVQIYRYVIIYKIC